MSEDDLQSLMSVSLSVSNLSLWRRGSFIKMCRYSMTHVRSWRQCLGTCRRSGLQSIFRNSSMCIKQCLGISCRMRLSGCLRANSVAQRQWECWCLTFGRFRASIWVGRWNGQRWWFLGPSWVRGRKVWRCCLESAGRNTRLRNTGVGWLRWWLLDNFIKINEQRRLGRR